MKHLNFCRQLTKQAAEMTAVPSLPELQRSRLAHAMDLCRASQKFLLPDGGRLFHDIELRALDETERLRLPHPFVALEYRAVHEADDPDMSELATRRIVFVREDDEGVFITPAVCFDSNGIWWLMGECFVPAIHYLDRSNCKDGAPFIKTRWPRGEDPRDYYDEVSTALSFLNALQCSNVHTERSEPKKAGKKIKAALPFDTYHVLTIDVPGSPGERAGVGGAHRSPREHLRRGHIRRLADGRRLWVNATVVAAGRGSGVVKKDYVVRCTA